jgi:hypothetical protein
VPLTCPMSQVCKISSNINEESSFGDLSVGPDKGTDTNLYSIMVYSIEPVQQTREELWRQAFPVSLLPGNPWAQTQRSVSVASAAISGTKPSTRMCLMKSTRKTTGRTNVATGRKSQPVPKKGAR